MGQCCISKIKDSAQTSAEKCTIDQQNHLIDQVLENKKFQLRSITEFGDFGPTINVKYPPMNHEYAVKILTKDNIGEEEIIWYELYNDSILSLIHIEFIEKPEVILFYSEDFNYSITEIVQNGFLNNSADGINRAIKWTTQIAEGMKYLHMKDIFHLNLTTDNVVITEDDHAKITNFHYLCSKSKFQQK